MVFLSRESGGKGAKIGLDCNPNWSSQKALCGKAEVLVEISEYLKACF